MNYTVSAEQVLSSPINELLFENSPIPKWIYDINTLEFLAVNEAAIRHYGYSENEFLQMTLKDIRPKEDIVFFKKMLEQCRGNAKYHNVLSRHLKKSGEIFYAQIYSHPIEFENRRARLTLTINVNDKVMAEKRNNELTEMFVNQKKQADIVLNSIEEFIWSQKIDQSQFVFSNKACEKIYGYTEQEMFGNGSNLFLKIVHPDDLPNIMQSKQSLIEGKHQKVHHEFRIFHKDGSIRHIASTLVLNKGNIGTADTIIGVTKDITESVKSENLFRNQAIELENILNAINDCYFTLDKDWNYIYGNDAYLKMIQKSKQEIVGKCIWEIFPYLDQLKIYKEYQRAVNEQVPVQFEEYSPFIDKWMSIRAFPTNGGLTVCLTNVTEQKKLIEKISLSEQNLKALIDNTQDFIFSVDKDLKIISINQPFKDLKFYITGVIPEVGDYIVPDNFGNSVIRQYKERQLRKALNGETFSQVEKEKIRGSFRYIESRFNPIKNNLNEIVGVSCFAKDITEQIQLNEKIANDEANLRALINNTKDCIFSLDRKLSLIAANESFRNYMKKISGNTPELGNTLFNQQFIEEADKLKWENYAQRAFTGESFSVIDESLDKSSLSYLEVNFNPIQNNVGYIIGVTCFMRDVTEQIVYFNRIEAQNNKLKEIAWIQSHQMRSKVATILGLGQLFNMEDKKDPINDFVVNGLLQTSEELDVIIREINDKTHNVEI